ncbi:unnamed protein product, partial [Closterium sp. NIES-54]
MFITLCIVVASHCKHVWQQKRSFSILKQQKEVPSFSILLPLPPLHSSLSPPQRCPSLAHLSLAGATITDASLDLIASHCPNLLSLSIKCCRKLLEPGVSALARCSRLQSLNAALVPGVTDVSAPLLFQGATALKTLVLNQSPLPDISLLSLSSHCHGLEELALHGCPRLTNE